MQVRLVIRGIRIKVRPPEVCEYRGRRSNNKDEPGWINMAVSARCQLKESGGGREPGFGHRLARGAGNRFPRQVAGPAGTEEATPRGGQIGPGGRGADAGRCGRRPRS